MELDDLELAPKAPNIKFKVGDKVVYPHHGAGKVLKKEKKTLLGEKREYLTIQILHNDMTVMVPCESTGVAGLRRVIDNATVKKVVGVLQDDVSEMPGNWNRRFKHNREKITIWGSFKDSVKKKCYRVNNRIPIYFSLVGVVKLLLLMLTGLLPFVPLSESHLEIIMPNNLLKND